MVSRAIDAHHFGHGETLTGEVFLFGLHFSTNRPSQIPVSARKLIQRQIALARLYVEALFAEVELADHRESMAPISNTHKKKHPVGCFFIGRYKRLDR